MIRTLIATAVALSLAASAANAMTVRNDGPKAQTVVFTPKNGKAERVVLRANHYKTFDCKSGGEVALGKDVMACTATTAKITIKGNKLTI